jgi:membrane protein DedA with SNARE-associated domain
MGMPSASSNTGTESIRRIQGWVVAVVAVVIVVALVIANTLGVNLIHGIQHLSSELIYVLVGLLVFAEAAIFLGFIIPGEAAVIIGGVLASGKHVNLVAICAVVVVAAILGDSVGYWIGKRFGDQLISAKALSHHRADMDRGLTMVRRRGASAVFFARFIAFLRAIMPGLAGAAEVPYGKFLIANALGGVVWGVGFSLLGWAVGYSYHQAELAAVWIALGLLIVFIAIATTAFLRARRNEEVREATFESSTADPDELLSEELDEVRHEQHPNDA